MERILKYALSLPVTAILTMPAADSLAAGFPAVAVVSQELSDAEKIASSQDGASPLVYTVGTDVPLVVTGDFRDDRECAVRFGLPNFLANVLPALLQNYTSAHEKEYCFQQLEKYPSSYLDLLSKPLLASPAQLTSALLPEQDLWAQKQELQHYVHY